MKVKVKLKGDVFTIHINDVLHLAIYEPIISMQSWNEQDRFWKIEFKTKNTTTLTEYDFEDKWLQILKEIDKI